jgi:hypothetical protein
MPFDSPNNKTAGKKNAANKPHLRGGLILKSQKEIASQELSAY